MAAADAQFLWLSAKVPNDQFLTYVFEGTSTPLDDAVAQLRRRADECDELRLRVHPPADRRGVAWRYPRWVSGGVTPEQFRVYGDLSWQDCLDAVSRLAADQLDVGEMSWRVHVFPSGDQTVVVVQMSHALGDGTRSAALAGALLGRRAPIPAVVESRRGSLLLRSVAAARAYRQLVRDVEAGLLPPPGASRPLLGVNVRPSGRSAYRVITVRRDRLPGPTVTVGALAAIGEALGGYLADRGDDVASLAAEVPMAYLPGILPLAHNNFRTVSVGLHPQSPRAERARRIAGELADHRRRGEHAGIRASVAATAALPAPLLRWGVGQFDPSARSATVAGHTVVSSVNRGAADLSFGGGSVLLTAGFPALSPMMSLTHGVHGIGDTVAVSVHADAGNVDVDDYLARLTCALEHPC
jgi:hypothetical protein